MKRALAGIVDPCSLPRKPRRSLLKRYVRGAISVAVWYCRISHTFALISIATVLAPANRASDVADTSAPRSRTTVTLAA
jgi:hypothetical protein